MKKESKYAQYGERVTIDADGTYRWRAEESLYTHPTELPAVYSAFGIIALIIFTIMSLIIGSDGFAEWWDFAWHFLLVLPVIAIVVTIAYYIVCWLKGGKYKAVFDMNETQIVLRQIDWKIKKKDVVGGMLLLAAALGGGLSEPVRGLNSGSRVILHIKYKDIVKIRIKRSSKTVYLHGRKSVYRVFVCQEDFDIVSNFIIAHCPTAQIEL